MQLGEAGSGDELSKYSTLKKGRGQIKCVAYVREGCEGEDRIEKFGFEVGGKKGRGFDDLTWLGFFPGGGGGGWWWGKLKSGREGGIEGKGRETDRQADKQAEGFGRWVSSFSSQTTNRLLLNAEVDISVNFVIISYP